MIAIRGEILVPLFGAVNKLTYIGFSFLRGQMRGEMPNF